MDDETRPDRRKPAPKPLDSARIEEMALAYVARFASSAGRLGVYLKRKLRERGWAGEDSAQDRIEAIIARFVELGYIQDEAYARMKAGSLLRRGLGGRRIAQALGQDGIDEDIRAEVMPGELAAREAALAYARRRGLGPFARRAPSDDPMERRARREKEVAAMLRAGHGMAAARAVLEAGDPQAAQDWVEEAREE
jgi:regulatory protein